MRSRSGRRPRSSSTASWSTTACRPRRPSARARALIDQWGVGRKGFDDGLAIFFDIDPSLVHGQVQLYAAPGFEAAYLSNSERQRDLRGRHAAVPPRGRLRRGAHRRARKVDAAATPEHAAQLQLARQVNAAVGLVGAPIVLVGLAGWALYSWRRFGKDPVYLDDPSILMPAPPPELTAASGAFVMDGGASRRALTTAMLDLASRGMLAFREDKGFLGMSNKVGVVTQPEPVTPSRRRSARGTPGGRSGPAEEYALEELRELGDSETVHRTGRPAEVRTIGREVRREARDACRPAAAGWPTSRARSSCAGRVAASS